MGSLTDAGAVAAVLRGEVEAFSVLVQRYRDTFARYATRMLASADDAEDVLQSAFVRAFRNLASCRDPERFAAWLFQIVLNECRTFGARRERRELRLVRDHDFDRDVRGTDAGDAAAARDEVEWALGILDADLREAFLLKHVEELSYDEMAEATGLGVSALKMRVKRACDRLRQILEEKVA